MNKRGFLDPEFMLTISEVRAKHQKWFTLCDQINEFALELLGSIKISKSNNQQVVLGPMYGRVVDTFQGIIIMTERGMQAQANMLLRCFLECIFKLKAIGDNADFAAEFVQADQKQRLQMLRKLRETEGIDPGSEKDKILSGVEQKLETDIKLLGIREATTKTWAERAGMEKWYIIYSDLCKSVHTSVRGLEQYLILDEGEDLVGMTWGPRDEEIPLILSTVVGIMVTALLVMTEVFDPSKSEAVKAFAIEQQQLVEEEGLAVAGE